MSSNTEVARRLYDAFAARDADALLSVLHPSFVGLVSAGMPLGVGGRHDGPELMLAEVWAPVFSAYDVVPAADELLPTGPDRVVAVGAYRGTARATGAPVNAAFAHVLRIEDGRVRERGGGDSHRPVPVSATVANAARRCRISSRPADSMSTANAPARSRSSAQAQARQNEPWACRRHDHPCGARYPARQRPPITQRHHRRQRIALRR